MFTCFHLWKRKGGLKRSGRVVTGAPWRHMRLERYILFMLNLGNRWWWNISIMLPPMYFWRTSPTPTPQVPTEQVAEWVSVLVWTLLRRKNLFSLLETEKQFLSFITSNIFWPMNLKYSLIMKRQFGWLCHDHCVKIKWVSRSIILFWHSEDCALWYILVIQTNEMHYFSNLFC